MNFITLILIGFIVLVLIIAFNSFIVVPQKSAFIIQRW
jgi:hypothetical protein